MCQERLEQYLSEQHIAFEVQHLPEIYTAGEIAVAEHIPGKLVAKTVIVFADGRAVMLVLPSTYMVDNKRAAAALKAAKFDLADEEDIASLFPDCEVGTMPPFGNLYDVPVYIDSTMTSDETIVFHAGRYSQAMSLRYEDFARLVHPKVVDFARPKGGYTA